MMQPMPISATAWDDLRVLLALHRAGTLAGAARALRVDATTVGRRLAAAEAALGARLFARTPEGLRPTAAGRRALAHAARAAEAVEALEREVAGVDARVEGVVRLTSGEGVLVHALAPALPALRARHPGLRLELVAATRPLDVARREADVAVRLFRPREPALVAKRVATLRYGLYAAPAYLARAGAPRSVADLAAHEVVAFDEALADTPEMRWLARHVPDAQVVVRSTSIPVILAACRAGAGIAAVAERFAEGDPALVRVLPRAALPAREAWIVVHPDLHRSARIAAVAHWIGEALGAAARR